MTRDDNINMNISGCEDIVLRSYFNGKHNYYNSIENKFIRHHNLVY